MAQGYVDKLHLSLMRMNLLVHVNMWQSRPHNRMYFKRQHFLDKYVSEAAPSKAGKFSESTRDPLPIRFRGL